MKPILEIDNFKLAFHGPAGRVAAVRGVSLSVYPGEAVALVGESGCGKTSLVRAVLGLHSAHAITESGSVTLDGCVITDMTERALESVRGRDVSMVFQDPMSSLNPVVSVGGQIAQAVRAHEKVSRREAWSRAVELLGQVGIPDPELRAKQYPHHFSGGMRQRVA
ncbi:MAG: ABC transporter ATP-binding protein, partial [Firmicutes bacterium]|nr:ABC transporter ATP-binding protein [Bacillota bacterium]